MIVLFKKTAYLACAAAAVLALAGCGGRQAQTLPDNTEIITLPTAPVTVETTAETNPMELVESLTVEMEAGELYTLDQYPNLKSVDFGGSTCYDAILHYMETHPQVDVAYSVDLGGVSVSNKAGTCNTCPSLPPFPCRISA